MGVADMHGLFELVAAFPPHFGTVTLSTHYLGGIFSLDGVHPGDFAQALAASVFLTQFDAHYGASFRPIGADLLGWLFLTDPFIDKDGDGRVVGRPGAGLLETLAPSLGFSGDSNDFNALVDGASVMSTAPAAFLDAYGAQTGRDLRTMTRQEQIEAIRQLLRTNR